MKNCKAAGIDSIKAEMLKALDEDNTKIIHKFCNKIHKSGKIPGNLSDSVFVTIPKKAKAIECSEFRTISFMSHTLKILLRVILNQNRHLIENEVDEYQSGFIKGKGTREGIFNMRTIAEKYLQVNKDVYVCFIDYEKAFDRVNHEKLISNMDDIGVRERDMRFIKNLYWKQRAYIRLQTGLSSNIKIKRGVRQGCILSPILFNLYTAIIFRVINEVKGVNIGGKNVNNLRYADDTALTAESAPELQVLLDKINEKGEEYGMRINVKKTKTMVISRTQGLSCKLVLNGKEIEQVRSFVYLGQMITENGKNEQEVIRRIAIGRNTFERLKKCLSRKELALSTRIRILRCYVWSTLLYGAETWTLTKKMMTRLTSFEIWTYRRMFKISWKDRVTNEEVLRRMGNNAEVVDIIKSRKLRYYGHMRRHDSVQRDLLEGRVEGKRSRGRPITTWIQPQHKRMDKSIDERGGDCGSGQEQLEEGYNSQRLQDTALNDEWVCKNYVALKIVKNIVLLC